MVTPCAAELAVTLRCQEPGSNFHFDKLNDLLIVVGKIAPGLRDVSKDRKIKTRLKLRCLSCEQMGLGLVSTKPSKKIYK